MELSQPRPYGTEGRKPTHDFLSLYNHSTAQQDPRPASQGGYLKTHDFLQPLERVGKATCAKEETSVEISTSEKPPPPAPPPVEHVLPGGIGTYSISHISYFNQIQSRVPKPEGMVYPAAQASSTDKNDENSNCSSFTGSGFTLWEEPAVKKGKTGKENMVVDKPGVVEPVARVGQWASTERPSQSSSSNHRGSFSSLSSSQPSAQRNQSFMEMIKSAKGCSQDDEIEEEDQYILKKEISTGTAQRGELRVKVDGKSSDQKANTPRSKHSATEQRRRSKINDRFQRLRELIPNIDQKRDKASFLLEVIEYIQYLQEKVHKHEGSFQGWANEPAKLMPWRNNHRLGEAFDHSQALNGVSGPPLVFASKFDEKHATAIPKAPGNAQHLVESDISTTTVTNKGVTIPMSLQPNFFLPNGGASSHCPPRLPSDLENRSFQPQSQLCQTRSCTTVDGSIASDKLKEEELTIEGGTISISTAYSQGLLDTLTQALQHSGVDLSQASISVQIELGKRASSRTTASTSTTKDKEIPSSNQGIKHSRVASVNDSDQAQKKFKTSKN
ncbi:transcription factor BIM1 isoform X2 [Cannabis sativa]|uniref:BHLH domain-containing protein n=1 Tax=Cannabis sativa TaxID=3483 RepID=A0A803P478_CANSA|nr:transcription factor BIM1 isoform X2 [Cannabis sativa]XP_060968242.1 transcription factor BIM1 isoform X2 [Cannabis sativa]XP_060968243.1 transcription factor BIM1 isoform X2 [Cannabis sativa]